MADTLQKRLYERVQQVFDAGPGAWLVWCDPHGAWLPLLQRVADDRRMGGFPLMTVDEQTAGAIGGPLTRRQLQERLDAGESFVLYVPAAPHALGWLWGQALLAEEIYARSLRGQLTEWGWRPHDLTVSDEEVAALARRHLQQDPAEWGSDGLQPDPDLLLAVLAGFAEPDDDTRFVLDLTLQQAALSPLEENDRTGWRRRVLAQLLVTQAHAVASELVPADHVLLTPPSGRELALRLLERWVDSHRLVQGLPEAILEADPLTGLAGLMAGADAAHGLFVSHAAEHAVFAATCHNLARQEGRSLLERLANLDEQLARHVRGLWGHRLAGHASAIPWGELQRLAAAARELVEATPTAVWPTPEHAVTWYTEGGWRMDRAGEEITRGLDYAAPALVALIAPLRAAYRARWEETLIRWSAVWSEAGCPPPAHLDSAGQWLKALLDAGEPSGPERPTAVLMVDALRYDLGCTLAERINHQEGVARAHVRPARAPMPTITALGMGLALPLSPDAMRATLVDGKWQLAHNDQGDNLSIAEKRRAWWQAHYPGVHLLRLGDVQSSELPAPGPTRALLVIHDAAIDRMGHDDELDFQGSGPALNRYLDMVERLRDQGWRRILVVTDHGYIHWTGSDERNLPYPAPAPAYASRRALAYPAGAQFEGPKPWRWAGNGELPFPAARPAFAPTAGWAISTAAPRCRSGSSPVSRWNGRWRRGR